MFIIILNACHIDLVQMYKESNLYVMLFVILSKVNPSAEYLVNIQADSKTNQSGA